VKRWILFFVVVFLLAVFGNWLWGELAHDQSGPLADVTWKVGSEPNLVKIRVTDTKGEPLIATLLTVYTEKEHYDLATNINGEVSHIVDGDYLVGLKAQHQPIFSKSFAILTGVPSLAQGIEMQVIAKRPDVIGAKEKYKYLEQPTAEEILKEQKAAAENQTESDKTVTPLLESAVETDTVPPEEPDDGASAESVPQEE